MKSKSFYAVSVRILMLFLMCNQVYSQGQNKNSVSKYIGGKLLANLTQTTEFINTDDPTDTLYSFPSPGDMPMGLAWDGSFFWHNDASTHMIYKLTTIGEIISSFPVPVSGEWTSGGLEWDGDHLWYAPEQSAILYKIDTATGGVISQFNLPTFGQADPNGWGLAWDGQYLWFSEYYNSPVIYKLNPQNGEIVSQFSPPYELILGITWADGYLYGVRIDNDTPGAVLYKIEPESGAFLDSTFWAIYHPLGLTWTGEFFWNVSLDNQRIYKCSNLITNTSEILNSSEGLRLNQSVPNPCSDHTMISFYLPANSITRLDIYSVNGMHISTLMNEELPKGEHKVILNTSGFLEGIYFCVLNSNEKNISKKIIKIR